MGFVLMSAIAGKTGRQGVGWQMKSSRVKVWAELLAHYCGDIGWGDREISVTSEIFF